MFLIPFSTPPRPFPLLSQEELFRRRKVQGLEILSRLVLDPSPPTSVTYPLSVPSVRPSVRVPVDEYRNTNNTHTYTGNSTMGSPIAGLGSRPLTANGTKAPAGLGSGRERSDSFALRREEIRGLIDAQPSYINSNPVYVDEHLGGNPGSMVLMGDSDGVPNATGGAVNTVTRPVRAVAGSKIPAPKQALTDAQKDSIVRQIRSASAGRVGREPSNSAVQQPQIAVTDTDSPVEMDFIRAEGTAYSADSAGQGVGYPGPQKGPQGKWGARIPGVGPGQERPVSRESQLRVQVPGQKLSPRGSGNWGNQGGSVSPVRSGVQGAGMSPRSVRDNSNSAKGGGEGLKHDARGDRDRDRDRDRDAREERGQREEKSEGRRPGAIVNTAAVDGDEAKRLEKFEKMRQKKIAEAQARALVRATHGPLHSHCSKILSNSFFIHTPVLFAILLFITRTHDL